MTHGRCQGRLIHCFKGFHAVHGDPGGESAYRQRDGNGSDEIFLVHLVLQPGMVSLRLFVAGRSMDPDHRHYRCLLPHLEACRMADAALSGVGCVRWVSESGGVVAEPVKEFS